MRFSGDATRLLALPIAVANVGQPANDEDGPCSRCRCGFENPAVTRWNAQPPMPPANAPIPTTEPTAARGNMSLASVYTLADQAWCAAAATLTTNRPSTCSASGASTVGTIRERHGEHRGLTRPIDRPAGRLIRKLESHPPPIEPQSGHHVHDDERERHLRQLDPVPASRISGASTGRTPDRIGQQLPAATAQVCLKPRSRIQGTRAFSGSAGSLRMCANRRSKRGGSTRDCGTRRARECSQRTERARRDGRPTANPT